MVNIFVPKKYYFTVIFRLSMVAGVVAAMVYSFQVIDRHLKEDISIAKTIGVMNCATYFTEEQLRRAQVENIPRVLYDVAKLGCGPGIDGKTYTIDPDELARHRRGEFVPPNYYPKFDLAGTIFIGVVFAVLINLLGLVIFGVYKVFQWVLGRPAVR
jgi:hypothetical protein